jgi:hypothetical protein
MVALRTDLQGDGGHLRTPEATASLLLGWEAFLRFATEWEAITPQAAQDMTARVRSALAEVAAEQATYISAADPVSLYIAALRSGLASGAAHLADANTGGAPAKLAAACGWRTTITQGERYAESISPGGPCVGWITPEGEVYLVAGSAYAVARAGAERAGTPLATAERTMNRRLHEAGKLAAIDGKHMAVKRDVPAVGRRPRVLWMARGVIFDDEVTDE